MSEPKKTPQISALTVMRHEITQHLHSAYNTNQLLSMRHKTPKDKRDMSQIKSDVLSALKKFSNWIDYSANPSEYDAYMQTNLQNVDIVKVIRSIYERIVELVTSEHKINFQLKTGIESVFVVTDVKRLETILYNLISNSARHANRLVDNKIVLEIKNNDTDVVISVRDLSGGITPEEEVEIFEAYKSAEASTICPATGLGLGLAVALKLANEMQGKIMLETLVGHGSEFSIILPKNLELPTGTSAVNDVHDSFAPDETAILIYFSDVSENGEEQI
ncbi:MAG: HAMP domain-containing histidine kinase [Oscillospiraceae bacterium]|nr:HAMP domain-containing histidine kinase [Oscillospiraceae bacterium]